MMIHNKEFKVIPQAPNYAIAQDGQVWSLTRNAELKTWDNGGSGAVKMWHEGRYVGGIPSKMADILWNGLVPDGFVEIPIDGLEGYVINESGRVFSLKHRECRVPQPWRGWHKVMLWNKAIKRNKSYTVHKLVMLTFGPPKPEWADQINHMDGDKANNHVTNLEWCDTAHNVRHAQRLGLRACKEMAA